MHSKDKQANRVEAGSEGKQAGEAGECISSLQKLESNS